MACLDPPSPYFESVGCRVPRGLIGVSFLRLIRYVLLMCALGKNCNCGEVGCKEYWWRRSVSCRYRGCRCGWRERLPFVVVAEERERWIGEFHGWQRRRKGRSDVAISGTFSCSCIAVIAVSLVVVSLLLCTHHPIKTVQSTLTMGRRMPLC